MTKPRKGYAEGPYGQVHYRRMGEGEVLVLIHQAAMDSRQFEAVMQPLADCGFDVVAFDLPGFGGSDMTPFVPMVSDLAKAISAAIADMGLGRVSIAGHHTGAMVATELAIDDRVDVKAVVLNGPMPSTEAERAAFFADKQPREKSIVPKSGGAHFIQYALIRERLVAGTLPIEKVHSYVIQALGAESPFWYGHNAGFLYRHEEQLLKIECPAMILTNTGDQIYEHAKRAHSLRPDMTFVELQGGGVDIVDQQPDLWASAVSDFVKSV